MKKKRIVIFVISLIMSLVAYCPTAFYEQGMLKGEVIDGFENVLKDVEVKIKDTKFITKTDENGQYRIRYNPGKVEILFAKDGFSTRKFILNIKEKKEVPMQKLTLWKLPESGGLFLVRMDDYKKIEKGSFYS